MSDSTDAWGVSLLETVAWEIVGKPSYLSMDVAAQQSWATEMRQKFSPPEMLNEDGSINQDFFKPTQVRIVRKIISQKLFQKPFWCMGMWLCFSSEEAVSTEYRNSLQLICLATRPSLFIQLQGLLSHSRQPVCTFCMNMTIIFYTPSEHDGGLFCLWP